MKWTIRDLTDSWLVTDKNKYFNCDTESDAQWLCDTLNRLEGIKVNDQAFDHWHEHGMVALGYINDRLAEIEEKQLSYHERCTIEGMRIANDNSEGTVADAAKELGIPPNEYKPTIHWPKILAKRAFAYADAMESERIKRITDARIRSEEAMQENMRAI